MNIQKHISQLQKQMQDEPHITHEFESTIKRWVEIDNQIKQAQDAIRILRDEQKQLGSVVITFIKTNNLEKHDIGLGNEGKLKLAVATKTAPITRKYIEQRLTEYFKSSAKAKEITEFIYDNREKNQSECIRRTRLRNIK